jgi:Protein of unknown function (DUF1761)
MIVLGIAVAAVAAFVASSVYYLVLTPVEHQILGDRAIDRRRPGPAKVIGELARTVVVAAAFAWIAAQSHRETLPGVWLLALIAWIGFPVTLLTGSIAWEKVPPVTAAIHAGDWLIKLMLIATLVGFLH